MAARNPVPDLHFGIAGTDLSGWRAPHNAATITGQAWQMRPNLRRSQHVK
jgi:hypothetical protein